LFLPMQFAGGGVAVGKSIRDFGARLLVVNHVMIRP
jgi:hypothetical protein